MSDGNDFILRRGDDRASLDNLSKFYNNSFLSDVSLIVGERSFAAHKIILAKSSTVFERMFSPDWHRPSNQQQIVELVEDPLCCDAFGHFLRFLYSNEVQLQDDLVLPLLILADKYNVVSLRAVCSTFAHDELLPRLDVRDVFNVWFPYSLKAGHEVLLQRCVASLADSMYSIVRSDDWLEEFLCLEKDQLVALLKSSDLKVKEEYDLWTALLRWLQHSGDRQARSHELMKDLATFIHFPMMGATQLLEIERDALCRPFLAVIEPHLRLAYKYHALPLSLRFASEDFLQEAGPQLLSRSYSDIGWQRRLVASNFSSLAPGTELAFRFNTRACAVPPSFWDWELKLQPRNGELRAQLTGVSVLLDAHSRAIEFLLAVVTDKRVVDAVSGRRSVNRNNPTISVDFQNLAGRLHECIENDRLILQLTVKPAG